MPQTPNPFSAVGASLEQTREQKLSRCVRAHSRLDQRHALPAHGVAKLVEILSFEVVRERLRRGHLTPDAGVKHRATDAQHGEVDQAETGLLSLSEMLLQVVPLRGELKVAAAFTGDPHARAPDGIAIEIEVDRGEPQPLRGGAPIGRSERLAAGVTGASSGSVSGLEARAKPCHPQRVRGTGGEIVQIDCRRRRRDRGTGNGQRSRRARGPENEPAS